MKYLTDEQQPVKLEPSMINGEREERGGFKKKSAISSRVSRKNKIAILGRQISA